MPGQGGHATETLTPKNVNAPIALWASMETCSLFALQDSCDVDDVRVKVEVEGPLDFSPWGIT
jgi:hypothetical protein